METAQATNTTTELVLDPLEALMGEHSTTTAAATTPPTIVPPEPLVEANVPFKASLQSFHFANNSTNKSHVSTTTPTPLPNTSSKPLFSFPTLAAPFKVSKTVSTTSVSASARVHIKTPLAQIKFDQGIGHYNPALPAPHLRPSLLKFAAQQARLEAAQQAKLETASQPSITLQTPVDFIDIPRLPRIIRNPTKNSDSRQNISRVKRNDKISLKKNKKIPVNKLYIAHNFETPHIRQVNKKLYFNDPIRQRQITHDQHFRFDQTLQKKENHEMASSVRRPTRPFNTRLNHVTKDDNENLNFKDIDNNIISGLFGSTFTCEGKVIGKFYADIHGNKCIF